MALTIRDIDKNMRKGMDLIKSENNIKTDSKCIKFSVNEYSKNIKNIRELYLEVDKLTETVEEYEMIICGLERYTARVNEIIRQRQLDL